MRPSFLSLAGSLLMAVGLGGFVLLTAAPNVPAAVITPIAAAVTGQPASLPNSQAAAPAPGSPAPAQGEITRLVIDSIGLDTPVTVAPLVDHDGVSTWDVPKFVAGHAEGSPGAGQPGNVVLIGHVTSLTLGNVFEHLDQVRPGNQVSVYGAGQRFEYRATDVRAVDRTDVGVLDPTPVPSLTLITCTGLWLPTLHDYADRLIVRAELI